MTVLDFAIIGVPLIIVLAILSRTAKGVRRQGDRLAEMRKAVAATHIRLTRARSRETENEMAAVRFVPIGMIPISASRSE
jgi:hypothetical protein